MKVQVINLFSKVARAFEHICKNAGYHFIILLDVHMENISWKAAQTSVLRVLVL